MFAIQAHYALVAIIPIMMVGADCSSREKIALCKSAQ